MGKRFTILCALLIDCRLDIWSRELHFEWVRILFQPAGQYTCDIDPSFPRGNQGGGVMSSSTMWLGIMGFLLISILMTKKIQAAIVFGVALVTFLSWFKNTDISYFEDDVLEGGKVRCVRARYVISEEFSVILTNLWGNTENVREHIWESSLLQWLGWVPPPGMLKRRVCNLTHDLSASWYALNRLFFKVNGPSEGVQFYHVLQCDFLPGGQIDSDIFVTNNACTCMENSRKLEWARIWTVLNFASEGNPNPFAAGFG